MNKQHTITDGRRHDAPMTGGLPCLLAFSCCLILSNLYGAQPIIADIAPSIGLEPSAGGMIVTMAQIGYCLGVLFLVPLGDLVDNRRLIAGLVLGASSALLAAAFSDQASSFLAAVFFIGLFSSAVQVIIPFGVGLAPLAERGRVIGLIASGAILGIVLSRPASSALTGLFGWRIWYQVSASLMALLSLYLSVRLPNTPPVSKHITYPATLRSMLSMCRHMPVLRLRLLFMASVFSCFTMFWATAPIVLKDVLSFSHGDIAMFSLASLAAPPCAIMAGRLADKGYGLLITIAGICMAGAAFLLTPLFGMLAATFASAVILLDPGVHMTNVVTQQNILAMIPEARSRLNALCVAFTFCGGAAGSSLGPWIYSHYGWPAVAATGVAILAVALGAQFSAVRGATGGIPAPAAK